MKKTRALCLFLALLICSMPLFSCAEAGGLTANTRGDFDGSDDIGDFAEGDFDSEPFTFLFLRQKAGDKDYYGGNYLDSEGLTGATMQDVVYKRNMAVEEKYNVRVDQILADNLQPSEIAQNYYMAGDFCFDVIYGWGTKMGPCIIENYFADLNSLENVDLTEEYWCPSAMDELSINGSVYVWINDISMNKLEWAYFLLYNKQLFEDYNVEALCGSPYDLVDSGEWTIDNFLKMVTSVSNDLDGDGEITKYDVFGMINLYPSDLAKGAGITVSQRQDDGTYRLSYYNDKSIDIANKLNDVYSNTDHNKLESQIWKDADISAYNDQWEYARSFFATDHALFLNGCAYLTVEFRDMESDFGILPYPKYDENQEGYIHTVSGLSSMFALPSTYRTDISTASPERTGMILEYMAYKSNEMVLPQYYDTLMKGQRLNSENDCRMLDIIRTSIRYEFCEVMGFGEIMDNYIAVMEKPQSASSAYSRLSIKLQRQLDDFYMETLFLDEKNED